MEHEHTARKCLRCGRTLRVSTGYGPRCAARIRREAAQRALAGFSAAQQAKARELIADGGLIPTRRPGVFRTVASKGDVIYLTHSATCTCPAGLRGRTCYHSAAARLILAA